MSEPSSCCTGGPKLIFACSGAADVGEITDRAARKLTLNGVGRMFCTAGLGGRISGILKTTESADQILAIDGCPLNCVKSGLEQAGFAKFRHLQLADIGLEKCKAQVTDVNINLVVSEASKLLA